MPRRPLIHIASYDPETIFAARFGEADHRGRYALPDGNIFRYSDRIKLFETKGRLCVRCGIEGTVFILETHSPEVTPHVNLYAVDPEGNYVLMTKDHILPRSKGGPDHLDNYDPMCAPCNEDKGNRLNHEL